MEMRSRPVAARYALSIRSMSRERITEPWRQQLLGWGAFAGGPDDADALLQHPPGEASAHPAQADHAIFTT
jgi:hypothetical protein